MQILKVDCDVISLIISFSSPFWVLLALYIPSFEMKIDVYIPHQLKQNQIQSPSLNLHLNRGKEIDRFGIGSGKIYAIMVNQYKKNSLARKVLLRNILEAKGGESLDLSLLLRLDL